MADQKGKRTRDRGARREQAASAVRIWPVGLITNRPRLRAIAAREFSFERFYAEVQGFAGSAVTRETLEEFMLTEGILLRPRPSASGNLA